MKVSHLSLFVSYKILSSSRSLVQGSFLEDNQILVLKSSSLLTNLYYFSCYQLPYKVRHMSLIQTYLCVSK